MDVSTSLGNDAPVASGECITEEEYLSILQLHEEQPNLQIAPYWELGPALQTGTDYKEAERLDLLARTHRLRPGGITMGRKMGKRNPFEILKEQCLCLGLSRRETIKRLAALSRSNRAQVRAKVAYQKATRKQNEFWQLGKIPLFHGELVERAIARAVCSEVRPKQNFTMPSSRWLAREEAARKRAQRELRKEQKEQRKLRAQAFEAELERRREKSRMIELVSIVERRQLRRNAAILLRAGRVEEYKRNPVFAQVAKKIATKQTIRLSRIGWRKLYCDDVYEGQMDADAHGESAANNDEQRSDTVIQDQREVSLAESFPRTNDSFASFSSTPMSADARSSADRWLTFYSDKWMWNKGEDSLLFRCSLPRYVIEKFPDSPNAMLFRQHVYWRGLMRIRVVVNSNLRQYGQLQCRFYYGANKERRFNDYKMNIYTGSQQPHCLISANNSNIGELVIPFEYYRPYLCIFNTSTGSSAFAEIGDLIIKVIVPLTGVTKDEAQCHFNVQICFEESEFAGQVFRGMIGQGPIANIASKLISKLNFDQPTSIQTGNVVVPQNASSWAAGTACDEWSVPLRLNPKGLLPYPSGRVPDLDEMNIRHLTSIFGLVNVIPWSAQQQAKTCLWSFDASPCWDMTQYKSVLVDKKNCYCLPPVSVISNMFAYWRGSLRLRLDIVGAADLTGRLMIVYVPRIKSTTLSFDKAVCCSHAIFDLQEKRQFVFDIPYVTDRMMWPRRKNMDRTQYVHVPPGRVFLYIYNDLIANTTIPSDCKIVAYLAGGDDFEVSVPSVPNMGLCFNTNIWLNKDSHVYCQFKAGYHPVYTGSWHSFGGGNKYILRYGEVSDHVVQMDLSSTKPELLYKKVLQPIYAFNCPITVNLKKNNKLTSVQTNANYFCLWNVEKSLNPSYWYMIPFYDKASAQKFAMAADTDLASSFALDFVQTSSSWASPDQMIFQPTDLDTVNVLKSTEEVYYGQMDERSNAEASLQPISEPSTTSAGLRILGETFDDLKDVARRFQRYADGVFDVDPSKLSNFKSVQLRFPAMPQGLDLAIGTPDSINEYWNRMRDGPIPIIASGYKFFTGGLRFRIVISTVDSHGNVVPAKLFVQHRPGFGGDTPNVVSVNYNWLTSSDLEMPGFAYHIQNEHLNNIISVEVPYYLPSIRGYLQRPNEYYGSSLEHSLGEVVVSCMITEPTSSFKFNYEIYYSLADDARFSLFQGFPPVFPIYDIADIRPKAEEPRVRRAIAGPTISIKEPKLIEDFQILKDMGFPADFNPSSIPSILEIVLPSTIEISRTAEWSNLLSLFKLIGEKERDETAEHKLRQLLCIFHVMRKYPIQYTWTDRGFPKRFYNGDHATVEEVTRLSSTHGPFYNEWNDYFALINFEIPSYDPQGIKSWLEALSFAPSAFNDAALNFSQIDTNEINETISKFKELDTSNINETINNFKAIDPTLINSTTTALGEAAGSVTNLFDNIGHKMDSITKTITGLSESKEETPLSQIMDKLMLTIVNISSFAVNPSITTFVTTVINVLSTFKVIGIRTLVILGGKLTEWLSKIWSSNEQDAEASGYRPQGDEEDVTLASYISTLVAGVAGSMNFAHSLTRDHKRSIPKILLQDLKDFSMTSNHLFTFCKNNITAIKVIMEKLWRGSPNISSLDFFSTYDNEIFEWAKECEGLLDGAIQDRLMGDMVLSSRVYDCANQATLIQLKLLDSKRTLKDKLPADKVKILLDIIKRILQLRDKLARLHIAPPVKFEPYVIHIYGQPGIGKSFISQDLPTKLLKHIGYRGYNELVYVRCPGNEYWNGLSHQPVVLYDDWYQMKTDEAGSAQLAEFLMLKTRAIFNPPMAHVDDKNIRYNPLIVFLVSNCAFPKYNQVHESKAIYRRVDLLVHVKLQNQYARLKSKEIKNIDQRVLKEVQHLEFYIHQDPENTLEHATHAVHCNYSEFLGRLLSDFKLYYENELKNYSAAIRRLSELYPKEGEDIFKLPNQQWWKKTAEYLNYVPKEDDEFSDRYQTFFRQFLDKLNNNYRNKSKYMKECFSKIFKTNYVPNAGEDENTVPKSVIQDPLAEKLEELLELYRNQRQTTSEEEIVVEGEFEEAKLEPDLYNYECAHSLLLTLVREDPNCINYYKDGDYWSFELNPALWHWELLAPYLDQRETDIVDTPGVVTVLSRILGVVPEVKATVEFNWIAIPFILEFNIKFIPDQIYFWKIGDLFYHEQTQQLFMPHTSRCNGQCIFTNTIRNKLCGLYLQNNQFLMALMQRGEDLTDHIPMEYLDSIKGIPTSETEEKLSWLKGFWKNITKAFTLPNTVTIYKWVCRLLWILVIISPVFAAMRLIGIMKKSVVDTSNQIAELPKDQVVEALLKGPEGEKIRAKLLEIISSQGFASGDNIVKGTSNTPKGISAKFLGTTHKGQMNDSEFESLKNVLQRNTFYLGMEFDDSVVTGRGLGIFGNVAILPTHYFDNVKNFNFKMYFISALNPIAIEMKYSEIRRIDFEDCSLSIIKLPCRIPLFRDISSRFATQYMHTKFNSVAKIVEIEITDSKTNINIHNVITQLYSRIRVSDARIWKGFEVGDGYRYEHFTGPGKCGSVLIATNLPQGIVGMHVAGSEKHGISEAICQEMVNQAKELFGSAPDPQEEYIGNVNYIPDTQILALGTVPPSLAHRENERSRIVPSLIQQYGDRETFPLYNDIAVLSPRDKRLINRFSPMYEGVKFHGKPLLPFDASHLELIEEDITTLYLTNCKPLRQSVAKLTKLEACAGMTNLAGYDHLEWRTSEGFPFVSERPRGVHDKKWLFEFDSKNLCIGISNRLTSVMKLKKQQRLANEIPFTVFTDCLKDTTVPKESIQKPGKTRVFSMAPVDFTIQLRQLTLDFSAAMMGNRLDLEHAVGINPDSVEWTELAERLLHVGEKIVTGDYSKFGDNIPFEIILMFFRVVNKWYSKFSIESIEKQAKNEQQRSIMAYEIGHSTHLMFATIYKCLCGQPSGCALTVLINSFTNSIYIRAAWLSIMKGTLYSGLALLNKHVRRFSYGDDIILSVSDEVAECFNARTLCEFFEQHKLKFTNANKQDDIVEYTSLLEADFLKRSFIPHPYENRRLFGLLLAPLSRQSIEDTINWVWNSGYDFIDERSPEFVNMCTQVCEDASRNAWTRGPEYYSSFVTNLRNFWASRGTYVVYDSWDSVDRKVFDLKINLSEYKSSRGF